MAVSIAKICNTKNETILSFVRRAKSGGGGRGWGVKGVPCFENREKYPDFGKKIP